MIGLPWQHHEESQRCQPLGMLWRLPGSQAAALDALVFYANTLSTTYALLCACAACTAVSNVRILNGATMGNGAAVQVRRLVS
jgi:hypothetical protein